MIYAYMGSLCLQNEQTCLGMSATDGVGKSESASAKEIQTNTNIVGFCVFMVFIYNKGNHQH